MLDIITAIENKQRITFEYKGATGTTRFLNPYLLGVNSKGDLMLRGLEISPVNGGLKLWRVADMSNIKVTDVTFLFVSSIFNKKDSQIIKPIACVS